MIEVSMSGLDQQAVLEMIPAGVIVIGPDGGANTVNQAFCDLMGKPQDLLLRQGWLDPFKPDSRTGLMESLAQPKNFTCMLQARPESCAKIAGMRFELKGQWSLSLRMHVCVLREASIGTRSKLGKEAERFRLLANEIPALIAYYEINGRCCFANRQYARTYGLTEESIVGLHYSQIIGEQAARDVKLILDEGARHNRAVSYARQRTELDGSKRWIEVNALPQLGADGKTRGAFVVVTDISKHRLAPERERARIARELHDGIAQWLVSLQFIVETAVTQVEDGDQEAARTLESALAQLGNVLREVRRISHDLLPGALENSGLAAAVKQLGQEFHLRSNVHVEMSIDDIPPLPDEVSTAFFRVAQEALGNVERHARASRVFLELRHGQSGLCLKVADNGLGFNAAHAFGPGKRGMGMFSMRDRIESLAGRFSVSSTRGCTSVVAALPVSALIANSRVIGPSRIAEHVE
jgi:PAS domain S-box-containing protein